MKSIEGWRLIKPEGVVLDLLDEWTFWAWTQGREELFLWRLQKGQKALLGMSDSDP